MDKYAYLAEFDEIAENDFNLNIPRYVDTFEAEAPVDMAAVNAEIATLKARTGRRGRQNGGLFAGVGIMIQAVGKLVRSVMG